MPPTETTTASTTTRVPVPLWQRLLIGRNPKLTLLRAALIAVGAYVVFQYILIPVRIAGISMEPTYRNGSINFINRRSYAFSKPERGDVIAVRFSKPGAFSTPHVMYFKRIIGLPGETIAITNGTVCIDGRPLDEPYVKRRAPWEEPPEKIAADEYYIIGDNRGMDQDLHEHGRTQAERIIGKVLW
jgi:signal peptidase I